VSNEENPEQQHGQPDPYAGWTPTPQGGEYDAEATAFVHLPPEDLAALSCWLCVCRTQLPVTAGSSPAAGVSGRIIGGT